jgi:hypothetical protein
MALGTPGLQETIEAAGVECFGVGPDTMDKYSEVFLFPSNLFSKNPQKILKLYIL